MLERGCIGRSTQPFSDSTEVDKRTGKSHSVQINSSGIRDGLEVGTRALEAVADGRPGKVRTMARSGRQRCYLMVDMEASRPWRQSSGRGGLVAALSFQAEAHSISGRPFTGTSSDLHNHHRPGPFLQSHRADFFASLNSSTPLRNGSSVRQRPGDRLPSQFSLLIDLSMPQLTFTASSPQRAKRNQKPHTSRLAIEGVANKEEAKFYEGKRVAYVYKAQRAINGSKVRIVRRPALSCCWSYSRLMGSSWVCTDLGQGD